jgi:hypothetical protein
VTAGADSSTGGPPTQPMAGRARRAHANKKGLVMAAGKSNFRASDSPSENAALRAPPR